MMTNPARLEAAVDLPLPAAESAPRVNRVRRLLRQRKALFGGFVFLSFVFVALFAPIIATEDPSKMLARPNQPPSAEHVLGTTGRGQDVFTQLIWGTRLSLGLGLATGLLTTIIGVSIGITAGYFGGWIDDLLSLFTNVVLIIPGLPLLVTLAAFLPPGPETIMVVLSLLGWAWPARVMRSQTLALREKDFVAAAQVSGESSLRIMFREILPNMTSLVASSFISSTMYAIGAEASLEFLGLGNVSIVSWGTMLFWAQNNSALLLGAWWTFVPAGVCIALVAFGLAMLNYAVDDITNPRLKAEKELSHGHKHLFRSGHSTPVVRQAK